MVRKRILGITANIFPLISYPIKFFLTEIISLLENLIHTQIYSKHRAMSKSF